MCEYVYNRRKFRSQTSDNVDRGKSRGGKSQRGEEKKRRREKIREEKESEERRCRHAKRSERLCFSTGSGGSKSRLAKAAGVEPPGQMRDEKVLAVVARSTDGSEKTLLKVQMWFCVAGARGSAPCQK